MWYVHFTFHSITFHWVLQLHLGWADNAAVSTQHTHTHTVSPQGVFNFHTFQVNQTGDLPIMCRLTSVRCELQILIKVSWGILHKHTVHIYPIPVHHNLLMLHSPWLFPHYMCINPSSLCTPENHQSMRKEIKNIIESGVHLEWEK